MNNITFNNLDVADKFINYPDFIKDKLIYLRELILNVAIENKEIGQIEESLKWGEPSYNNNKTGSAIRIDWKKSCPNNYMMYFNCKTSLIKDFSLIYPKIFNYSGNRAIIFNKNDLVPEKELKKCIYLSLTYKIRKSNNIS